MYSQQLQHLDSAGYTIIEECLSRKEINDLSNIISTLTPPAAATHAIRHLFAETPALIDILANSRLVPLLNNLFDTSWFVIKSILFDKPSQSDWLVNQHQDSIINTMNTTDASGFTVWKKRPWGYSVQPPDHYLKNIITVRVHLDDCDEANGALKIRPGTHLHGILNAEEIRSVEPIQETICPVQAGGVLLMKPLLIHASAKNISNRPRRVIHLECTSQELPAPLQWGEYICLIA